MLYRLTNMLGFFKRKALGRKKEVPIDSRKPLKQVSYVFIDTELTGLNERTDSIISIGAIKMVEGRIELGDSFYSLVNPKSKIGSQSIFIHTITPSEVKKERGFQAVLNEFLHFCGPNVLIGHCVAIDLGFINKEMKENLGSALPNPTLDTFVLYHWLWRKWPSEPVFSLPPHQVDLYRIAASFGISSTGAHQALMDAFITAQVFQRLIPWLERSGINDLEDLLRVGNPFGGGENRLSLPAQINNL
ncbi:MAG: 3'-5' exonuclease [Deltaproteobacteria bacterium]|nr:3'-5' exonuclease [Deltaproteobacteria bacterium]